MLLRTLAYLFLATSAWSLDPIRAVQSGRPFAPDTVAPIMNRGYLFFITHSSPELDAYTPTGQLAFATIIRAPGDAIPSLSDAAVDDQGRFAISFVYRDKTGVLHPGIALLDASGKQTSSFFTGLYQPSHLCFGPDGSIWTTGWQRDPALVESEDRQDYFLIRRFDLEGNQTGAFIKRSSFPAGLPQVPALAAGGESVPQAAASTRCCTLAMSEIILSGWNWIHHRGANSAAGPCQRATPTVSDSRPAGSTPQS